MSFLLAIETSAQFCSVALYLNGEIEYEVIEQPQGHTKHLLPLIDRQLANAGVCLEQLDAITLSAGPGSFTGLRIGMGVVQGLAFGSNLPVIPVSTLQTLAQRAIREGHVGNGGLILPILDARMHEVYWGLYRHEAIADNKSIEGAFDNVELGRRGLARVLINDQVDGPQFVSDALIKNAYAGGKESKSTIQVGTGDGWHFVDELNLRPVYRDVDTQALAIDLLPLALEKLLIGDTLAPEALEPFYIRSRIHWQKRQRLS